MDASKVNTERVGKYLNSILSTARSIQNGTNNIYVDWQEVAENFELIADDARLMGRQSLRRHRVTKLNRGRTALYSITQPHENRLCSRLNRSAGN
jgi:hypothetical protein